LGATRGGLVSQDHCTAYLTDKCEVQNRDVTGGKAVFAREVIEPGELIGVWSGRIATADQLDELPEEIRRHTVQVEEGLYLASLTANDAPDFINHSCEPNAGLDGQVAIVALHRILPGEEVTIDYAMCDGSAYDEFDCACGSHLCRGRVTGDDWRNPVLWERYAGHFSPYLARRIEALKRVRVTRRPRRKLVLAASQAQGGA
ncbi:MAG: SET domain-containing protein, partial [Actinomycetota bacterium]